MEIFDFSGVNTYKFTENLEDKYYKDKLDVYSQVLKLTQAMTLQQGSRL